MAASVRAPPACRGLAAALHVVGADMRDPDPELRAMNGLEPGQVALLRGLLEARLAALLNQGNAAAQRGARDLAVDEVETSPADKATVRLLNDLAQEAAGHSAAQVVVLRRALDRIDEGSYGSCEECGNDIGFSRMQACPEARLCITCQTRAEKR